MNFFKKWYIYQKERFPILIYGSYIFAIVFATYCFIIYKTRKIMTLEWNTILVMFFVTFLQFLMVRIIDEFKDYEEDCKFRAYRPVPRGLITLNELKVLFIICLLLQIIITLCITPLGLPCLFLVWLYFGIMSKSFFIKKVLEKHLLLEVALDELLMPILICYLSGFVPYVDITSSFYSYITLPELSKFLLLSYMISWIVEIARKVRCKEDEEKGVKTYTAVFGIKHAMSILFVLQLIVFILQISILGKEKIAFILILFTIVSLINLLFAIKQNKFFSKLTELSANIYIFIVYFSMLLLVL